MRFEGINNFDKRNRSKTVTSLQADSEGVFFSSESAEKKHTGWVGQCVPSIRVTYSRRASFALSKVFTP